MTDTVEASSIITPTAIDVNIQMGKQYLNNRGKRRLPIFTLRGRGFGQNNKGVREVAWIPSCISSVNMCKGGERIQSPKNSAKIS